MKWIIIPFSWRGNNSVIANKHGIHWQNFEILFLFVYINNVYIKSVNSMKLLIVSNPLNVYNTGYYIYLTEWHQTDHKDRCCDAVWGPPVLPHVWRGRDSLSSSLTTAWYTVSSRGFPRDFPRQKFKTHLQTMARSKMEFQRCQFVTTGRKR